MSTLRVLIVDDEPVAREGLRAMLATENDVDVIGEAGTGPDAIRQILLLQPDVVLLDIKMPGLDGFDVVRAVGPRHMPTFIFVSAHDQHALEAFGVHAADYVLKPVDPERLIPSIRRIKDRLQQSRSAAAVSAETVTSTESTAQLAIRDGDNVRLLKPNDISAIETDGNYVRIYHLGSILYHREPMKSFLEKLPGRIFVRVSRFAAVNLEHVESMRRQSHGGYRVLLKDGRTIQSSRRYREHLERRIHSGC